VQQLWYLAVADMVAPMQQRHICGSSRTEAARRHIRRPARCDQLPAGGTAQRMIVVRGD
jgi:hypothetical protein